VKIAFVGLDGSGKTTQASLLTDFLKSQNYDVRYRHQFRFERKSLMEWKNRLRPLIAFLQVLLCIEGSTVWHYPIAKRIRRNVIWKFIRPLIAYPVGYLVLIIGLCKARGKWKIYGSHNYFIMDRCFFDELVRVEWKLGLSFPFHELFYYFAPHPDMVFYFNIPGAISWSRMEPQDTEKSAMILKEYYYQITLPEIRKYTKVIEIPVLGKNIVSVQKAVLKNLAEADHVNESSIDC
jgi:GTPase SAR1 family protein